MATTRQTPTFQIYQDTNSTQIMSHPSNKPRPQLQPSAMPLQPIRNPQSYQSMSMQPLMSTQQQQISPLKSQHTSPPMPQYPQMNYMPIPPPVKGSMYIGSPTKRAGLSSSQPYQQGPVPPQPMFSTFNSNLEAFSQPNFHVVSNPQNESVDFPVPSYPRRQPLKRSLSDATIPSDRPLKKIRQEEDCPMELPDPKDMPPVHDDGGKPGHSYAQMIGMAILRAPNRRLTLSQIYAWISSTFAFYRDDPKQGWHNSIRHNLSLNKAFKKQERPKSDAGKGCYWVIESGMEAQFFKDRNRKHPNAGTIQNGMRSEMQVMAQPLAEAMTPSWCIQVPASLPPRPQTAPALPELSSDATLPASDPALNEEETTEAVLPSTIPPSSPVPVMNSSPPVAAGNHNRRTISSPVQTRPSSSRQHKRNVTAVHDSGYFSELPSSVRRSKNSSTILPSDIHTDLHSDLPRKKHGRAEEEIVRMRSSPHITPKARRFSTNTSDFGLSSPPNRPSISIQLDPTTPAVQFKKPYSKAPPSLSPNTQLQQHRLMMQDFTDSPLKGAGLPYDALPDYSPQFKMPMSAQRGHQEEFSIFDDSFLSRTPTTPGLASSPLKSARKPSLLRSYTSASILRDVTNTHRVNAKTPSKVPVLKPPFKPVSFAGSPLKKSMLQIAEDDHGSRQHNFNVFDENIFDDSTFVQFEDHDDEPTLINDEREKEHENSSEVADGDEENFDLAKGFATIGQGRSKLDITNSPLMERQRPILGRSFTSAF